MAFTIWALMEASLLVLNAICILHEERFLAECEYELVLSEIKANFFDSHPTALSTQLLSFLTYCRFIA